MAFWSYATTKAQGSGKTMHRLRTPGEAKLVTSGEVRLRFGCDCMRYTTAV